MYRLHEVQALKAEWDAWLLQQKPLERHWCTNARGFAPGVDEKAEERDTRLQALENALSRLLEIVAKKPETEFAFGAPRSVEPSGK